MCTGNACTLLESLSTTSNQGCFQQNFFDEIDKIYYLSKDSPKRLTEQKQFGTISEKTLQKPSKSMGTHWIAYKVEAMEVTLANCIIFIAHIESLSRTD